MKTKKINLGRIVFTVLFTIQFSVLTTGCKYLEGNELLNKENVAETEAVTETEVIESIPQTEEEIKAEEEKVQTQLWMDKIADTDWKDSEGRGTIRFTKPIQEGDIIRGEYKEVWFGATKNYKYTRLADGEILIDGGYKFIMKLNDEADTLSLNYGSTLYTFLRN